MQHKATKTKSALNERNVECYGLKQTWQAFIHHHPHADIRQAATALQVSEAELVAADYGLNATRLQPAWTQMAFDLQSFGKVSAMTPNASARLHQTGIYQNIRCTNGSVIVHGSNLELGFNVTRWHSAFAVEKKTITGKHHGLLFFDRDGHAIHEVSMTPQSCLSAYRTYIRNYKAPDDYDEPLVSFVRPTESDSYPPVTAEKLQRGLQDCEKVQDFSNLLNKYGLTRYQALHLAGNKFAVAIEPNNFREFIQTLAAISLPVTIYIPNRAVVQTLDGSLGTIEVNETNLSLFQQNSELHIDLDRIDSLWVVKKPVRSRMLSSLELYDAQQKPIALIYGGHDGGTNEDQRWRELTDALSFSRL